jgi:hypothetical protein
MLDPTDKQSNPMMIPEERSHYARYLTKNSRATSSVDNVRKRDELVTKSLRLFVLGEVLAGIRKRSE